MIAAFLPYILAVGLALAGLWAVYHEGQKSGRADQWKLDKPIIEAQQTEGARLKAANEGFERDLAKIQTEAAACSARVEELGSIGKDVRTAVDKAIAESRSRTANLDAAVARLRAAATAPATGTPAEQCESARGVLADLAARVGAAPDPAGTGPKPPPAPSKPPEPTKTTPPPRTLPPAVRGPSK